MPILAETTLESFDIDIPTPEDINSKLNMDEYRDKFWRFYSNAIVFAAALSLFISGCASDSRNLPRQSAIFYDQCDPAFVNNANIVGSTINDVPQRDHTHSGVACICRGDNRSIWDPPSDQAKTNCGGDKNYQAYLRGEPVPAQATKNAKALETIVAQQTSHKPEATVTTTTRNSAQVESNNTRYPRFDEDGKLHLVPPSGTNSKQNLSTPAHPHQPNTARSSSEQQRVINECKTAFGRKKEGATSYNRGNTETCVLRDGVLRWE